jgi:hypothetical protein
MAREGKRTQNIFERLISLNLAPMSEIAGDHSKLSRRGTARAVAVDDAVNRSLKPRRRVKAIQHLAGRNEMQIGQMNE